MSKIGKQPIAIPKNVTVDIKDVKKGDQIWHFVTVKGPKGELDKEFWPLITLELSLGFSHPIEYFAPEGISFEADKTVITIRGIDKQLVGQVAAEIRAYRKPEPYKGKGIMYRGEKIRRKAGKKAAT